MSVRKKPLPQRVPPEQYAARARFWTLDRNSIAIEGGFHPSIGRLAMHLLCLWKPSDEQDAACDALYARLTADGPRQQPATVDPEFLGCTRCGAEIKSDDAVWLELHTTTGRYVEPGSEPWSGGAESQGGFPFGGACARAQLQEDAET